MLMAEEKITCDDLPLSSIFTFKVSNKKTYMVQSCPATLGHNFKIFESGKLIKIKFIRWAIPPDYTAAKELLEIFLNE